MRCIIAALREWWHWNGWGLCGWCRRPFKLHAFWNPDGPGPSTRLCCSEECCDACRHFDADAGRGATDGTKGAP